MEGRIQNTQAQACKLRSITVSLTKVRRTDRTGAPNYRQAAGRRKRRRAATNNVALAREEAAAPEAQILRTACVEGVVPLRHSRRES
jgi:hypothetical protein